MFLQRFILSPLVKTLGAVSRANLFRLMWLCAGIAIIVVLFAVGLITWMTAHFIKIETQWIHTTVNWLAGLLTGVGGWFMLPALIVLIAGMFQETIIHRVETVYYPEAIRSDTPRLWPDMLHDIRFTLWALFLNILVLPFYFMGIGFLISVALNSYLLGREFFESAAGYHLGKPEARALGQRNTLGVLSGGLIITLATLVPVLNVFAPILAIVWMVHVYHGLAGEKT